MLRQDFFPHQSASHLKQLSAIKNAHFKIIFPASPADADRLNKKIIQTLSNPPSNADLGEMIVGERVV